MQSLILLAMAESGLSARAEYTYSELHYPVLAKQTNPQKG